MAEIVNKSDQHLDMNALDQENRNKIAYNISLYNAAFEQAKMQYTEIELAKERAAAIKYKVLNELDKYLIEFETNFVRRGGKVIWARNEEEAIREILTIVERKQAKLAVKSKSSITEEIHLNEHLEKAGIEVQETNFGEFFRQESNDKSYHFVNPVINKNKEDLAAFFHEKFDLPVNVGAAEISWYVRNLLREKLTTADVVITGANFLIADVGGVALTENEGNALMSVSFSKTHIVIAGIEKVIPAMKNLDLFWPLLATHGTGQKITAYNSVVLGPKQEGEIDGTQDMYVILLDNGRTNLLEKVEQRRALSCIHCGACLNACPVYKTVGGEAYQTTYTGPIGAVITPHLKGLAEYNYLSFMSSLCGSCSDVCPVKINLHELLIFNRNDGVTKIKGGYKERLLMYGWKKFMGNRKYLDAFSFTQKNWILKTFFSKIWGPDKELPVVKEKSFKELWEERNNPLN
jgi:L-lactate dehydrogenase complex protein LldF